MLKRSLTAETIVSTNIRGRLKKISVADAHFIDVCVPFVSQLCALGVVSNIIRGLLNVQRISYEMIP